MANTNKEQFKTLIDVFEKNKKKSNDIIVEAMRQAEPRIKDATLSVYRSTIEIYKQTGVTGSSTSTKFNEALKEHYGEDSAEVRDENLINAIAERNHWKAEAERLQGLATMAITTLEGH